MLYSSIVEDGVVRVMDLEILRRNEVRGAKAVRRPKLGA